MANVTPDLVIDGLIKRGFKPHEAAGIAANFAQESSFRTDAKEIDPQTESARRQGGGFGLAQWTDPERKQGLVRMAAMRGAPADDLDTQLDYFKHEMETTHKKAFNALRNSRNPRQAAFAVSKYYEIPAPQYANNAKRMSLAEQFFNAINPISSAQADEIPSEQLIQEYQAWKQSKEQPKLDQPDPTLIEEYNQWKASKQNKNDWTGKDTLQAIRDIGGGLIEGVSDIGNTLLSAGDAYNEMIGNKNALSSLETTGKERKQQVKSALKEQRANDDSALYQAGKLGAAIAGTAGIGQALGAAVAPIPILSKLSESMATGGMKGGNLFEKILGGGATGAASTALVGEDPNKGAMVGMALPPAVATVGKVGGIVGKGASRLANALMPERGAAQAIRDEIGDNLPKNLKLNGDKFKGVEGVKPTAGMLSNDPAVIKLEMNARLRNPEKFMIRDNQNTSSVVSMIEKNALDSLTAKDLRAVLNEKTGQLRESAFQKARENPTFRENLVNYFDELGKQPGIRNSKDMNVINRGKQSLVMMADKLEAPISKSNGINLESDSMLDAIKKLGGINKELSQKTYGNKIWEDIDAKTGSIFKKDGGYSLDDMTTLLKENGYLDDSENLNDLVDHLYYSNPAEKFSKAKTDYSYMIEPQSSSEQLHMQLNDLITELQKKNGTKQTGKLVSKAQPEDIYKARKELLDALQGKGISFDDLTNSAKSNRKLTMDITNKIDAELDASSGGAWSKYLDAYSKGMKPIEQGRAFQKILDKFESSPRITGTEQPKLTPAALRRAVNKETWKNLADNKIDKLNPQARKDIDSGVAVINAIEKAKNGAIATNGSQTMTFASSLAKSGLIPGGKVAQLATLLNNIFESRGQRALDDAMLNPEKLQKLIDMAANKAKPGKLSLALEKGAKAAPFAIPAGIQLQTQQQ